eukprot:11185811-Lingulodinium_polyedra.AAC.1
MAVMQARGQAGGGSHTHGGRRFEAEDQWRERGWESWTGRPEGKDCVRAPGGRARGCAPPAKGILRPAAVVCPTVTQSL